MLNDSKTLLGLGALALLVFIAHRSSQLTPEQLEAKKQQHRAL